MLKVLHFFLWIFVSLAGSVGCALLVAILFDVKLLDWATRFFVAEILSLTVLIPLFFSTLHRADRLSLKVGVVQKGSPEEKSADRVLLWFELADSVGAGISILSGLAFLATFIFLTPGWLMSCHLSFTALTIVFCWYRQKRLALLRAARGYGSFKRLSL